MVDTTAPLSTGRPWKVALISSSVLILELALIRQVPSEVRVISYFTNLILMATFFGLGSGMIVERRFRVDWTLPVGLIAIAGFVYFARGLVIIDDETAVHYFALYDIPEGKAATVPILPAALVAFVACALPFVALGNRLGREMDALPRLAAYGWDICGSLVGTAVFAASSAAGLPPWIWPPVLGVAWAVALEHRAWPRVGTVAASLVFFAFADTPLSYTWSPYYFIQHQRTDPGLRVWVNSSFHQFALDLVEPATGPTPLQVHMRAKFAVPYEAYRQHHGGRSPKNVLVLGAGTGNDVNIALLNDAQHVVAVEIDREILALGREYNTRKPYDDPRVSTVLDDARHFLHTSSEHFDLIVFGTLDSQTLLSSAANIRLENYVYTQESFRDARSRLADGGMLATYYSAFQPWFLGRLYATVCPAFEGQCALLYLDDPTLFNVVVIGGNGVRGFKSDPRQAAHYAGALAATDDWPFLYLETPQIAPVYLGLIAGISMLIAGVFGLVRRFHRRPRSHLHFWLLGVGFTLMESAAIVRLALLFGSTWIVSSIVFSAVLSMILLANLCVLRWRAPSLQLAWGGIVVSVVLNLVVELPALLNLPVALQVGAAAVLIGAPVFFAAVCFSQLFARETSTGYALGVNLIGAMAGGLVEYLSMLLGTRAIWALVLVIYLSAYLVARRQRSTRPAADALDSAQTAYPPAHSR